jgi:hypothetical protein
MRLPTRERLIDVAIGVTLIIIAVAQLLQSVSACKHVFGNQPTCSCCEKK